jgi:hypothetical protein
MEGEAQNIIGTGHEHGSRQIYEQPEFIKGTAVVVSVLVLPPCIGTCVVSAKCI